MNRGITGDQSIFRTNLNDACIVGLNFLNSLRFIIDARNQATDHKSFNRLFGAIRHQI